TECRFPPRRPAARFRAAAHIAQRQTPLGKPLSGGLDDECLSGNPDAMAGRSIWQDGRRSWERLNGWHQASRASPGHKTTREAAERALQDIRLIRGLLQQAEMNAVKTARVAGASWAEIATMLGVSRQSAWERWRDLDDSA